MAGDATPLDGLVAELDRLWPEDQDYNRQLAQWVRQHRDQLQAEAAARPDDVLHVILVDGSTGLAW